MTYTITVLGDETTKIDVSFADEDVVLTGCTYVKGGEEEALAYLPTFERDLRRNYAHLFPQPEIIIEPIEEAGNE